MLTDRVTHCYSSAYSFVLIELLIPLVELHISVQVCPSSYSLLPIGLPIATHRFSHFSLSQAAAEYSTPSPTSLREQGRHRVLLVDGADAGIADHVVAQLALDEPGRKRWSTSLPQALLPAHRCTYLPVPPARADGVPLAGDAVAAVGAELGEPAHCWERNVIRGRHDQMMRFTAMLMFINHNRIDREQTNIT